MQTTIFTSLILASCSLTLLAADVRIAGPNTPVGQYYVSERGPHHRVWLKATPVETNDFNQVFYETNSFTELRTGLHRAVSNSWVETSEEISLVPGGGAATNTAHNVFFAQNANTSDALVLTTPEGKRLASHVLCLSYLDTTSGSNVVIAGLSDSIGQILEPYNRVLYTNALVGNGCVAHILYQNSAAGLEQNILFQKRPAPPSAYGLGQSGGTVMLQVWSEFVECPTPAISPSTVAIETAATAFAPARTSVYADCELDFGLMKIGRGKAFSIGNSSETEQGAWVLKQWFVTGNPARTFLVEQVPLEVIASQLQALPPQASVRGTNAPVYGFLRGRSPASVPSPARFAQSESKSMVLAKVDLSKEPGLILDYSTLQSAGSYTLQSDTTYLVSGQAIFSVLTVEGGTVVKMANTNNPSIIATNVITKTGLYKMAAFTAMDDTTIGEIIGTNAIGSTYYGNIGLDLSRASSSLVLSNLHFRYLSNALAGTGVTLRAQIIQCKNGFAAGSRQVSMYNGLISLVNTVVNQNASTGDTFTGENVTAHYCTNFMFDTSGTINLTNCLFVSVTNWQCTQIKTNASVFLNSDAGVFQTFGAGSHYLVDFSIYRAAGTTNIDSALLSELTQKTTYPPILLTNLIVWPTNLTPRAQRGLTQPDIGYCYSGIDYAVSNCPVTNTTLRISPGTVIAYYDAPGLWLQDGTQIICVGSPTAMIRFTDYRAVQEQPLKLGAYTANSSGIPVHIYRFQGVGSPGQFRFTAFSRMAGATTGYDFYINDTSWYYSTLDVRDCSFLGGSWFLTSPTNFSLTLLNNVFERARINSYGPFQWTNYNNLFRGGIVSFDPTRTNWIVRDNIFDSCLVDNLAGAPIIEDHNALINATLQLQSINAADIQLTNFVYASGRFGDYYQVSTNLVDQGSRTAPAASLYQYTTQTNEAKEALTQVDIGAHFVAADTNGLPVDTGGGGAPDYLANGGGDGTTTNLYNWLTNSDAYRFLLTPGYLRCEYRVDPWGVDTRPDASSTSAQRPRLFWIVTSPQRAEKQVAYRVVVASSSANASNNIGDIWDSGKVYSDQTIQVEYDSNRGQTLQSGQRLWWKVRSWDLYTGLPAGSTNGFFQMGLLRNNDWTAQWLTTATSPGNASPMYRKTFVQQTNQIVRATAYVTARGVYELWIDGQRIGKNILAPEWTDYNNRIQYQTFDVTSNLTNANYTDGTNHVIGGIVGV